MTYARITTGLHNLLASVDGLKVVIEHEPTAAQDSPLVYSILEDFTNEGEDVVIMTTYRTMHRLCIRWQDSEQAETTFRTLVDSIPAAFRADPTLSGYCRYTNVTNGDAGWTTIGGTEYRTMDFYTETLDLAVETRS